MHTIVAHIFLFGILTPTHAQTCGLSTPTGTIIPPDQFLWPYPLPDNWEPEKNEFWSSPTLNVIDTAAVAHPHIKYISAYRYPSKYTMKTKAAFLDFLSSEDNTDNMIHRTVRFNCSDGSETSYNFHIPVEVSDKAVPIFQKEEYTFKIVEDWPSHVSINQGQFLIVGDSDDDLANARLTFDILPEGDLVPHGFPLWPEDNPPVAGPWNYRVELYTRAESNLSPGSYEFSLIANSRKNSGQARIKIEVV